MNLPQSFRVLMLADDKPKAGLLLGVTLRVCRKNDFCSIWGPSNSRGVLTVTRDQLLSKGEADRNMFLMDYGHPEVDFTGVIALEPYNAEAVQRAINAYKEYDGFFDFPPGYHEMLVQSLSILKTAAITKLSLKVEEIVGDAKIETSELILGRSKGGAEGVKPEWR